MVCRTDFGKNLIRFKKATFLLKESQPFFVCSCYESLLSMVNPRHLLEALYSMVLSPYHRTTKRRHIKFHQQVITIWNGTNQRNPLQIKFNGFLPWAGVRLVAPPLSPRKERVSLRIASIFWWRNISANSLCVIPLSPRASFLWFHKRNVDSRSFKRLMASVRRGRPLEGRAIAITLLVGTNKAQKCLDNFPLVL